MAEKRMFSKSIVNSDAFLDMPLSTQALYFHLGMEADDEGFVGNPKRIQRIIGASDDDMKILLAKRYLLSFESGIVVVKHWYINNFIRQDRVKETTYLEERDMLRLDEKKSYTEKNGIPSDNQVTTKCQPRLDKNRLEEIRLDKNSVDNNAHTREEDRNTFNDDYFGDMDFLPSQPTLQEIKDYIALKGYNIDAEYFYDYYSAIGWKMNGKTIEDWRPLVNNWARKDIINDRAKQISRENINKQSYPQREYSREDLKGIFGSQSISDDEI